MDPNQNNTSQPMMGQEDYNPIGYAQPVQQQYSGSGDMEQNQQYQNQPGNQYAPPGQYNAPPPSGYPQNQNYGPPHQNYGPPPQQNNVPPLGMALHQDSPQNTYNHVHHQTTEQQVTYGNTGVSHQTSEPKSRAPVAMPGMFQGVSYSVYCTCPSCKKATNTRVETRASAMAWILCLIMFLFGFWLCCLIPFCVDGMKDGNHYCTNCGNSVGRIGN